MIKKAGIEYETIKMDVSTGKEGEPGYWILKDVEITVPKAHADWARHLTTDKVAEALREYHVIRAQDRMRTAHKGTKLRAGASDAAVRTVGEDYEYGQRTRIAAERRPPTVAEAETVLLANADALRAMIAKAKAMGMEL